MLPNNSVSRWRNMLRHARLELRMLVQGRLERWPMKVMCLCLLQEHGMRADMFGRVSGIGSRCSKAHAGWV